VVCHWRRAWNGGRVRQGRACRRKRRRRHRTQHRRCAVNPGFFRTDLLTQKSASYAAPSIADYADRSAERVQWYESMHGQQAGDPAKLARALITIASQEQPPRRFIAGADAIAIAEQKAKDLQEQANAYRDLSNSLAREDATS
jgi:hypothetical protein